VRSSFLLEAFCWSRSTVETLREELGPLYPYLIRWISVTSQGAGEGLVLLEEAPEVLEEM
jgi:hypothetical protein